jgi:hypothetical protein
MLLQPSTVTGGAGPARAGRSVMIETDDRQRELRLRRLAARRGQVFRRLEFPLSNGDEYLLLNVGGGWPVESFATLAQAEASMAAGSMDGCPFGEDGAGR